MQNYYEILGVTPESTPRQIKSAFREKAKKLHPDVAGQTTDSANAMRNLLEAYEILGNLEHRIEYDRLYKKEFARYVFNYRAFLKDQTGSIHSMAKLIFFDLLHGYEDEAIEVYKNLCKGNDFALDMVLDREDAMDCAFLLAEAFEKEKDYFEAFRLYCFTIREERKKPYFKHFLDEVTDRIKLLLRLRLAHVLDEETLLYCLEIAIHLGYSKKEKAVWYKKRAEIRISLQDIEGARLEILAAIALDPEISGIKPLKRKTGID